MNMNAFIITLALVGFLTHFITAAAVDTMLAKKAAPVYCGKALTEGAWTVTIYATGHCNEAENYFGPGHNSDCGLCMFFK
jgi:hypothetical protein